MLQLLQRTRISAQATAQKYASYAPRLKDPSSTLPSTTLLLSIPPPLTPQLVSLGLDEAAASRLSSALERSATRLKGIFEADFLRRRLCIHQEQAAYFQSPKHSTLIPSAYSTIYAKALREWSSYILADFAPRFLNARSLSQRSLSTATPPRRLFNQSAVPMLEKFFDQNAFPSRLDKYELASQCEMEYRQIHVWFQNRRSRYRKEGKDLRKPVAGGLLSVELQTTVDALLPSDVDEEGPHTPEAALPDYTTTTSGTFPYPTFNIAAPAHAFPSPYPSLCPYDPFPLTEGKRSFHTPWPRRAVSSTSVAIPPTVHQVTLALARLSIEEPHTEVSSCLPPSNVHSRDRISRAPLGFVTPCSRAPHPSLVARPRRATWRPCVSTSPPISTGDSKVNSRQMQEGTAARPNLHTVPLQPTSRPLKRGLPRRIPQSCPIFLPYQHATSPFIQRRSSVTPRVSSTSSATSKSSSSGSDVESPLSTPPSSPSTSSLLVVPPLSLDHADDKKFNFPIASLVDFSLLSTFPPAAGDEGALTSEYLDKLFGRAH